ncbi:MAG: transposase [Acidobacteria bacterium]|nr:transposase [Acidobacteriota bacterium]
MTRAGTNSPGSSQQAANAGREVILVNPAYTSQDCSQCGSRGASLLR